MYKRWPVPPASPYILPCQWLGLPQSHRCHSVSAPLLTNISTLYLLLPQASCRRSPELCVASPSSAPPLPLSAVPPPPLSSAPSLSRVLCRCSCSTKSLLGFLPFPPPLLPILSQEEGTPRIFWAPRRPGVAFKTQARIQVHYQSFIN